MKNISSRYELGFFVCTFVVIFNFACEGKRPEDVSIGSTKVEIVCTTGMVTGGQK